MSRLRSIALAIQSRIEEIPELAKNVVVFRRSDIETEFEKRMGKTAGKVVIVRLISGKNTSPNKLKPRFSGSLTVSLFTVPLLTQKDAKDSDALMDEIATKLHGWWPDSVPSNGAIWLSADTLTFPQDALYDVSVLSVNAP
jgi:hypothetical protein